MGKHKHQAEQCGQNAGLVTAAAGSGASSRQKKTGVCDGQMAGQLNL